MILPSNAAIIISAVRHIIKLGVQLDNLSAEKAAVQADLVLQLPKVVIVDKIWNAEIISAELKKTALLQPDPFGNDRVSLQNDVEAILVRKVDPSATFGATFKKYFPDTDLLANPDAAFLAKLREAFPGIDWKDPGARIAVLAIGAGTNKARIGYNARMALSIADTLFEFGAENTALFVRDEKLRSITQTVLESLSKPEWGSFEQWNPLLQAALKSVLNAALDVADKENFSNKWLESVLDALVQARTAAKDPDNYLLGLLQGNGFQLLLSKGLLVAGDRLDDSQTDAFRLVAADVLRAAAPLVEVQANASFRSFFNAHWGDLLRAGLSSVDQHGDLILKDADPLLGSVLKEMVKVLAKTPDTDFLTSETVYQLADTAIGVVADNVDTLPGLQNQPWLRVFLTAAAATAKQLTVKNLFTKEAAEALVLDAVGALAKHPDLLIKDPGLAQNLVASVLGAVGNLKRPDARTIGEAAVRSALEALAKDPSLAGKPFTPALTAVATTLAGLVGERKLTGVDAATLATTAIEATLRNPQIFAELQKDVASAVIKAVQEAIPHTATQTWAGPMLVQVAQTLLLVIARFGAKETQNKTTLEFQQWLKQVLDGGLKIAADQLGGNLDRNGIPNVLAGLVEQALRGGLKNFDPSDPAFKAAFDQLASSLSKN